MGDAEQLAARSPSAVECGRALSQLKDAAWTVSRGHAETQASQRRRADRVQSAGASVVSAENRDGAQDRVGQGRHEGQ